MDKVINYLLNELKLNSDDTIVIGNSGGPDSMALFDILLNLRKKINFKLICAHVNHNVRVESKKEEENLREYCKRNDVPFEFMIIEKYGNDNFHNEARNIRYTFFESIIKKYNANYLFTAHHGDDLMETILMRIVRGSTLKGYSGFNILVDKDYYKIVRPLIFVTKKDTEEYCLKHHIDYAIDKSNFKDKYTRNRYRKTVLPFLKNEEENVHEKFLKFSNVLNEYDKYIEKEINKYIKLVVKNNKINIEEFKKLDELIKSKIIYHILENIYNDDLMLINDTHVKLILDLINSKKANSTIYLPLNMKAVKNYNELIIEKDIEDVTSYELELIDFAYLPNGKTIEKISSCDTNGNDICRLDSNEINLPLYVRTRKLGDKISLKGTVGHKKLKDIFIDSKIPIRERDKWPVVVDSKDEVIWIPGIKKSKKIKQKSEKHDIILRYK